MPARAERLIGQAANAGTVVLLLLLTATTATIAWPRVSRAIGIRPAPLSAAYAIGSTIDLPIGWFDRTPHTLVLFARASCGACQTAAPYLTQLVAHVKDTRVGVLFAAAGAEEEDNLRYATALGFPREAVRTSPADVRARVTPTLVLVDRHGLVIEAWEGIGPEAKQRLISAAIDRVR
jgi:hypothetical protein